MRKKKIWLLSAGGVLAAASVLATMLVNASAAASMNNLLSKPDLTAGSVDLDSDIQGKSRSEFSPENHAGEGYVKKAETAGLELYFRESDYLIPGADGGYHPQGTQKKQDIAVYDKRTGRLWTALVDENEYVSDNYAESLTAQFQSLVTFSYIDAKKDKNKAIESNVMSQESSVETEDIDNGVRVNYDIGKLGIRFSVEFRLGEDFLDVRIPDDSISETLNNQDKIQSATEQAAKTVDSLQQTVFKLQNDFKNRDDASAMMISSRLDRISRVLIDISGGNLTSGESVYESLADYTGSLFHALASQEGYEQTIEEMESLVGTLKEDLQILSVSQLCGLMRLNVLPYFGCGNDRTEGYVFYPEGSGAISYFNRVHSAAGGGFRADVYTNTTLDLSTYSGYQTESDESSHETLTGVKMPVFGIRNEKNAFVAVITDGDSNASIVYNPSLPNIKISNAYAGYYYRLTTQNTLSDGTIQTIVDSRRISQRRAQRYYFLEQERADYSGMAVAYRDYLESRGLLNRSPVYDADAMPLSLTVFSGLYSRDNSVSARYTPLTSFSQTQEIVEALRDKGVKNLDVTLSGWSEAGYHDRLPDYEYKPDSAVGGKSGLSALLKTAEKNQLSFSLETGNVFADKDTVKYADSNSATVKNYGGFTITYSDLYLFNPFFIFNQGLANAKKVKSYGQASLTYREEGWLIYSDYNSSAAASREDTLRTFSQYAKDTRDALGGVRFINSNVYTARYADWVKSIPEKGRDYLFTDENVPFYQIVLHGSVPYTGTDVNTMHDAEKQLLKAVEYGYIPSFTLTYETPNIQSSYVDFLFSSRASDWYAKIAKIYQDYLDGIGDLWKEKIQSVEKIDGTLSCVTYENGARILLNYADSERICDGVAVPAMNYRVIR